MESYEIIYGILISLIFIVLLITPVSDNIFHLTKNITLDEQREYARAPELSDLKVSLINYTNNFENYYNDHFGARALLIKISGYFKYYLFHSSIDKNVALGKNGWIYNIGFGQCWRYSKNISNETLLKWKNYLEEMNNYSLKNNITFIFVIVPNKETIYPEYYPQRIKIFNHTTDQLMEYLKANTNISVLDLRESFLKEKNYYQLFYKKDHHWTNIGAYFGYVEILNKLKINNNLEFHNLSDFRIDNTTKKEGYNARALGLGNVLSDNDELYVLKNKRFNIIYSQTYPNSKVVYKTVTSSHNNSKPNIFMMGDSFLSSLLEFISPSGNNVTFIVNYPDEPAEFELMKKQNISIIIYERYEYNLLNIDNNPYVK